MIFKEQILELIALAEGEIKQDVIDSGLFTGYAGLIIYYFEKSKLQNDGASIQKLDYCLNKALESIGRNKKLSLCSGNVGIYYSILYLANNKYLDIEIENYFDEFLSFGKELLAHYHKNGNFDYLHGLLGVVFFYAELFQSVNEGEFKENVRDTITLSVALMEELSERMDDDKISWLTVSPDGRMLGHNLGLAHGVPSVISILTKVYKLGIERERVSHLLKQASNFMFSIQGDYAGSCYPSYFVNTKNGDIFTEGSRLAWCYGDLGVGLSLLNYGSAVNDPGCIQKAHEILLKTTKRDCATTGIKDIYVCHGTVGLFLIYDHLFKLTGMDDYRVKSLFWLEETVLLSKQERPGLKTWLGSEGWIDQDSILEGKAGLVLALFSYVYHQYSNPLEIFLLLKP